ncbi:MAG: T9SS type A sorting domain-containing protein [Bacteroidetes bacterium]|nr:T9SS type A sorting domain-containing protein [Bacteroidota bacterium]
MKRVIGNLSLILIIITAPLSELRAQWVQTNGPYNGGPVCSLGVTDSLVYAGTVGYGVYRSSDGGVTWVSCTSTAATAYALSLAGTGNYLYAGSGIGDGISVSTDGGVTWSVSNTGLPPNPWVTGKTGVIDRIAASGQNVFLTMRLSPGTYLSTDNGLSWVSANAGSLNGISSIAVGGNDFFVGGSDGVYVSSNAGTTWSRAGLVDSSITSLAAYGLNMFASTNSSVFLSTNAGSSWMPAETGLPDSGIEQLSANGGKVMVSTSAGFYLSTDNSSSWHHMTTNGLLPGWASPDAFVPMRESYLLGYFDFGVYRSTDGGMNWIPSNSGIATSEISSLAAEGRTVFASRGNYLFRYSDDDAKWSQIMPESALLAVLDTIVFATGGAGVMCTTDGGATWMNSTNKDSPQGVEYTVLVAGGGNLYLGSAGICGLCNQEGISLSTDRGASWTAKGLSNVFMIAATQKVVYAVYGGGPLVRSLDSGSTWQSLSTPVSYFNTIAAEDSEVYAGTNGHGVLRSTDYGVHWVSIDSGLPSDSDETVYCFAFHGSDVFAGTGSGVYVLSRRGSRWAAVGGQLAGLTGSVRALAVDDSTLYAATSGLVWRFPLSQVVTAVEQPFPNPVASAFRLSQNYPNPFNPSTTISYQLPTSNYVTLKVFDVLGREVETLVNERQQAGTYTVRFTAANLPSGVYFYRLEAGTYHDTKKLLLLK